LDSAWIASLALAMTLDLIRRGRQPLVRAFSSEVGTGSRQENASEQKLDFRSDLI
jgi:hypothetical protein